MNDLSVKENGATETTHLAYLWIHALSTPMWAIFNMLPYILYKDLHATPLQVTAMVTLKPLVSLLSVYWGEAINQRRDRLLANVIWGRILSLIPFFFFPFVDNTWFFIGAFSLYMLMARGVAPAWMEILKLNLPKKMIGQTFSKGALIGYCGNIISPFVLGWLLDNYFQAWRWLFPIGALISFTAVILSWKIPIPPESDESLLSEKPAERAKHPPKPFMEQVVAPWKSAWQVLRGNVDFCKFQWGFMLGGAAAMIAQPVLPQFCVDVLNLSYTEMTVALSSCKGIGFILTTPLWGHFVSKMNIFRFASGPPFWIIVYSACLLLSQLHISWLYIAYFCYGIMEGGSSLSWNLSGPIFAKETDSSRFTNVNVLSVGVRACIFPPLGGYLGLQLGSPVVIALGGLLSIASVATFIGYATEDQSAKAVGMDA